MVDNISFFTPVDFVNAPKSFSQKALEKIDDYFYLSGRKAYVIQGRTDSAVLGNANFSLIERIAKIFSYFTVIAPLVFLVCKAILRSKYKIKLMNPKDEVEKGVNVSSQTITKIQNLISKIIKGEKDSSIEWLATGNNLVFKLKENPNLVFKMARTNVFRNHGLLPIGGHENTNSRFDNMVKAKEICLVNNLSLLILPSAKKFSVNVQNYDYTLIAEESLDFNPYEYAQESYYHKYSKDLNETARQLAIFVAKTGFNDVTWRNIPIINEPSSKGPKRVGLIDIEHMKSAKNGFIGDWNGSEGLIRCIASEEQIDIVIAEARKQGIQLTVSEANDLKKQRLKEIEEYNKLQKFHEKNGIKEGNEPLNVDLNTLGLNLNETAEYSQIVGEENGKLKTKKVQISIKKVAEDFIGAINKYFQTAPRNDSFKGQRYLVINTNLEPFNHYNQLGLEMGKGMITKDEEKKLWLRKIINALIDKGHLFKLVKSNGHGYFVQA